MGDNTNSHGNATFAAFATGSLIGLALGLLYAPKRGQESRQIINDKIRMNKAMLRQKMYRAKEAMRTKEDSGIENENIKSDEQGRISNESKGKPSDTLLKTG